MMFRHFILICWLFLNAFNLSAQTPERTKLLRKLEHMPEDTAKIRVYFDYGLLLERTNIDSAIYYYQKGRKLAEKYRHVRGQLIYASYYTTILNEQGKLDESLALSRKALKLSRANGLQVETAKSCNNLANVYNYLGECDSAMIYFLEAARIFEKINYREHLNVIYGNIGSVFLTLQKYEQALAYSRKSIRLSEQKNDDLSISFALTNVASALSSLQRYEEALDALDRCLRICKKVSNPYAEQLAYIGIGNAYSNLGKYDQAIAAFQKTITMAREMGYTNNLANALNGLGMTYHQMGNYARADQYASEALKINEQYHVFNNTVQQYKLMADIRAKRGQYASAYEYLEKYNSLNDSLTGIEVQKNADELEKKYQTAQKDKKLAESRLQYERNEKSIQQKDKWLIASAAIIVSLALLLLLFYFTYKFRRRQHEQKVESLRKEQEVIRLKATLEGQQEERQRIAREMHDEIGSGLTTILFLSNSQSDSVEDRNKKIAETAQKLILEMKEIVWSMNTSQDKLDELVAYIRFNISELLQNVGMDYEFRVPDDLPNTTISGMQRRNIYLAVKEAVHNCIKHSGATKVTIEIAVSDGIRITITDNGRGLDTAQTGKFGNGIKNMQLRMEQIGGVWEIVAEQPLSLRMAIPASQLEA